MTYKEKRQKNKEYREQREKVRAELAEKETKAIETFRSLNIQAGDFIQVSYKSFWRIQGETTETEIWYADSSIHNHYANLPFLKNLSFWNLRGGYELLTSVGKFFDIKKIEATQELLERVQETKDISNNIYASYNSGGQYKGD